jgi:ribonuclease BN (tRNA processing enzyme)
VTARGRPWAGEARVRLVILGSGTAIPSGTRSSAGYWLEDGELRLRLDCGSGTVHASARHGLDWKRLTHQFISHFHLDHVGELPALLFGFRVGMPEGRDEPVKLVGPAGLRALVEGWSVLYRYNLMGLTTPVEIQELSPGSALELTPNARLSVAKAPHTAESLAVRIDTSDASVGYTGDTAPSAELIRFFSGTDILISECSFLEPGHKTAHLSVQDVGELAAAAGVRHLVVTHSYFDPKDERLGDRLSRHFGGRISVAADGMSIDLSV